MNWFKKLFAKRIEIDCSSNDAVTAIELDESKTYILLVKRGSISNPSLRALESFDPSWVTIIRTAQ